jgi:hypothetical protein
MLLKTTNYYGSSITIQPQRGQGMSSIVFSSSLTIADAIAAAAKLKYMLKVTEFEQGMSAACSEMSEEQILHDSTKPSTFRMFFLDIACGSLAFSKDLSSINHARNVVRVDGIFSKDVPS